MNHLAVIISLIFSISFSQNTGFSTTPEQDLGLIPTQLQVPEKFNGLINPNLTVNLPKGFVAKVFHIGGLSKPRFFAWSTDSILHVANLSSGKIIALPDLDKDGIADTAITVAGNFRNPHDLAFYNGDLYVAEEHQITKLTDSDKNGKYENRQVIIDNIPTGGHYTRTIVFDPPNKKMYLSIGSSCNVCRENDRAIIEQYNDDGSGRRTFSTGVRNAVGMTLRPSTGKLWATNNGSDRQGNNIPPEWIDIIRDGGFYGHPFAYANQVYFDFYAHSQYTNLLPITSSDSARVRKMVQPAALVQAHSAPMAIKFGNNSFLPLFQNGAFVAYRGSWNRWPATGYKIVYLNFTSGEDTTANFVADFLTGFLTDSISSPPQRWARPVGIETDNNGNLYVGSDAINEFIMIIVSPDYTVGVEDDDHTLNIPFNIEQNYPNPFNPSTTIRFDLPVVSDVILTIYNTRGQKVKTFQYQNISSGYHSVTWNGTNDFGKKVGAGVYLYQLMARLHSISDGQGRDFVKTKKMILMK